MESAPFRVSAICPVFNTRPGDLRTAVRSALGQVCASLHELILVDDGTTAPDTKAALLEVSGLDNRISIVRTSQGGPAAARNMGLSRATGDWIGFLDSDDLWPNEKLARAAQVASMHPNCHWIIGDFATLYGTETRGHAPGVPCFSGPDPTVLKGSPELTRSIILDGLHLGTCIIRRTAIGDLRFDPAILYGEDLQFLAQLSLHVAARRAPGLSYVCRRGQSSMMYSAGRLSSKYASGMLAGRRNPTMRSFRREMRWTLYRIFKELAVNNVVNGNPWTGIYFAARALCLDPRELGDAASFLSMLIARDAAKRETLRQRYSTGEQFVLGRYNQS